METTFIPASTTDVSGRTPTTRSFSDLRSEDFFKLLIAELQSQDPLNPTDNQALLDQMSSIRQMEQSTTLNTTLQALASEQRFGATASLIGQYVVGEVNDSAGNLIEVKGIVTAVRYEADGSAVLELHDGKVLPADKVSFVTLLENLSPEELQRLQIDLGLPTTPPEDGNTDTPSDPVAEAPPATGDESGDAPPAGSETTESPTARYKYGAGFGDPASIRLKLGQLTGADRATAAPSKNDFWRTLLGL